MQKKVKIFTVFFVLAGLISGVVYFELGWFKATPAQAAISFVSCGTAVAVGSGNLASIGIPAGIASNDILVVFLHSRDNVDSTMPIDWTAAVSGNGNTTNRLEVWWKRTAGAESAPTIAHSGGNSSIGKMCAFRGVVESGTPFDVIGAVQSNGGSPISTTAITTTTNGAMIVHLFGSQDNNNWGTFTGIPTTVAGSIETNGTGTDDSQGVTYGAQTSAGTTGTAGASQTSVGPDAGVSILMALKRNEPPTLSISQPDGTADTIAQDASYSVTYTLSDTDNVVTAALYYDINNSGLDGTAISGCGAVAEGTGATCSWNTTGVTPGTYYVYGIASDGVTQVSAYSGGVLTINARPTLSISQPDGTSDTIAQNGSYNVTYSLADTDNVVTAAFYYDTNNSGLDGTAITGACATAAEGSGVTCAWNTTGVTPGTYYVYGITNDGTNAQVSAYSSGFVTINAAPTLSISQPDGISDTVTQGDSFNITYSLADSDNTVTAAFYYDSNNSGLDGTAITGACATAAEGSGVTCAWNTASVTPGTYYVYGITNDGINSQVSAYSGGTITINAPANAIPTLSISQPDGISDTVTQGDSFNITYSLADTDNVVTGAFYYDANNSGLDGTAISGCGAVAEGAGATCSWNTTGVTAGSYYVYGITNDGVNPQVSAYSGGTLTINAPAVISVDSITPNAGALAGGTSVTIAGSTFQSGATITFDGISATDIVFVDSSTLTAKTPAHAAGMVDVVVTNPDLTSDTLVSGFTYTSAAVVTLTASPMSLLTGESFVMSWSTENASSCSASGSWSGSRATSGNETIAPASTGTYNYVLECTGSGGSGSDSVSVTVSAAGAAVKEPGFLFRFDGFAYPDGKLFLYDNTAPFSQLLSDVSGRFATSFRLMSLVEKHLFSVIAYDREGNASPSKTFSSELYGRGGLTDILIAPTIVLNKRSLTNRESLRISGYATPGNKVQVEIDNKMVATVGTTASGYYTASISLASLAQGEHRARAMQVAAAARVSDYSLLKTFQIADSFTVNADLNSDGKLTINDWSIFLSSWSSKEASIKSKIDLNGDGRITIADLSLFLSGFRKK